MRPAAPRNARHGELVGLVVPVHLDQCHPLVGVPLADLLPGQQFGQRPRLDGMRFAHGWIEDADPTAAMQVSWRDRDTLERVEGIRGAGVLADRPCWLPMSSGRIASDHAALQ